MFRNPATTVPVRSPLSFSGPDDVRWTVAMIEKLIMSGSMKPYVIQTARAAAAPHVLRAHDAESRRRAAAFGVWDYVRQRVAFLPDPNNGVNQELLQDCENILRVGSGDCDEHTILCGAMLRALGFSPVDVVVGGAEYPEHVFLVTYTWSGSPLVIDSTLTDRPFGTLAGDGRWQFWCGDHAHLAKAQRAADQRADQRAAAVLGGMQPWMRLPPYHQRRTA